MKNIGQHIEKVYTTPEDESLPKMLHLLIVAHRIQDDLWFQINVSENEIKEIMGRNHGQPYMSEEDSNRISSLKQDINLLQAMRSSAFDLSRR